MEKGRCRPPKCSNWTLRAAVAVSAVMLLLLQRGKRLRRQQSSSIDDPPLTVSWMHSPQTSSALQEGPWTESPQHRLDTANSQTASAAYTGDLTSSWGDFGWALSSRNRGKARPLPHGALR